VAIGLLILLVLPIMYFQRARSQDTA
jgi:hypothetical protein